MKKSFLFALIGMMGLVLLPGLSHAQISIAKGKANPDVACKISTCLTTAISGGVVKDDCEGPLEVFFLQTPGTNKAAFLKSHGYDYDPKTNGVVKRNTQKKPSSRAYNSQSGKFEIVAQAETDPIPKTPREELLSSCPSCTQDQMDKIIAKYGETKRMPDIISYKDTACEAILCVGGLAMGASGGSDCTRSIAKYKSQLAFNSDGFDPGATADKRRNFLNKCGEPGTGEAINKIQNTFGRRESF